MGQARLSSPQRPPKGRGLCGVPHVGPSAPAGFRRVHRAFRFAFLLLQLCQGQFVAGTRAETIQLLPVGLQHQLRQTCERLETRGPVSPVSPLCPLAAPQRLRGQSPLSETPRAPSASCLPPALHSASKGRCLPGSHLFDVDVGAGTCFIEVHAVFPGQLQEEDIAERKSREGAQPWHGLLPLLSQTLLCCDSFSRD